jgi:hypothetical protein
MKVVTSPSIMLLLHVHISCCCPHAVTAAAAGDQTSLRLLAVYCVAAVCSYQLLIALMLSLLLLLVPWCGRSSPP